MLLTVVPCVYCASFHRHQQIHEQCSSAVQVKQIPNHSGLKLRLLSPIKLV